jgi:hypothetical protein
MFSRKNLIANKHLEADFFMRIGLRTVDDWPGFDSDRVICTVKGKAAHVLK